MNYYLYVYAGKGNFLAATVNEEKAIHAVALALVATYPEWDGVKVFRNGQVDWMALHDYKISA